MCLSPLQCVQQKLTAPRILRPIYVRTQRHVIIFAVLTASCWKFPKIGLNELRTLTSKVISAASAKGKENIDE
jgi:hypothetical protein